MTRPRVTAHLSAFLLTVSFCTASVAEVRIANVSRGVHALTQALAGKRQLSDATDDALAAEPELDVGTAVQWLAGEQIISGFNLAGASPAGNTAGNTGNPGEKHPE